jgi:hypothetical protein
MRTRTLQRLLLGSCLLCLAVARTGDRRKNESGAGVELAMNGTSNSSLVVSGRLHHQFCEAVSRRKPPHAVHRAHCTAACAPRRPGREDSLLCMQEIGDDGELRPPYERNTCAHCPADGAARGNEAEVRMDDDDADSRANR